MSLPKSNARRSEWKVVDRCLALLLRLMTTPSSSEELLEIVYEKAKQNDENLSRSAALRRFEGDRSRLKEYFRCEIDYDRSRNIYTLLEIGYPLIDLPPDALRGMAFLQMNFTHENIHMQREVQALINLVYMILPIRRRRELERERGLLEVDLQPRDQDNIMETVWEAVKTSCSQCRLLEFEYRSSSQKDGQPRTHLVEPLRYYLDSGHYCLEAYWLESRGPKGSYRQEKVQSFRLGRIQNPHVLPNHFMPRRSIAQYELIYQLTPEVARLGVTEHFSNSHIIPQPDNGAVIHAISSNLFVDLRKLLHYGPNCQVIGGQKAVEEMGLLVKAMYEQYRNE